MKKKSGKTFILSGLILLFAGLLTDIRVILRLLKAITAHKLDKIGIIGGADEPTARFLIESIFRDMNIIEKAGLLLIIIALLLIIIGIIKCIINKHNKE